MSSIVTEQSFGAAFPDLYMNEMLLVRMIFKWFRLHK